MRLRRKFPHLARQNIVMQNHFELFQLPQQFSLDMSQLDRAYHEVQNQVHPDKFVQAGDAEKRVAMQWATRANEAYQTLKKPLKRATYLCELQGVDLQTESNTSMPASFLMQQMEWREALDEADSADAIEALLDDAQAARKGLLGTIERLIDTERDAAAAAQQVRALMFIERFAAEVDAKLDKLSA